MDEDDRLDPLNRIPEATVHQPGSRRLRRCGPGSFPQLRGLRRIRTLPIFYMGKLRFRGAQRRSSGPRGGRFDVSEPRGTERGREPEPFSRTDELIGLLSSRVVGQAHALEAISLSSGSIRSAAG